MIRYTNNSTNMPSNPDVDEFSRLAIIWATIYSLVAVVTITGNLLVLYALWYGKMNIGRLGYLDNVIKSLALNDLLIGLVAIPFQITMWYYLGKVGRIFLCP